MSIVMRYVGLNVAALDAITVSNMEERFSGRIMKHPSGRVAHYFKEYWKKGQCIFREEIQDTSGRNVYLKLVRVIQTVEAHKYPAEVKWSLDEMLKAVAPIVRTNSDNVPMFNRPTKRYAVNC